MLLATRCIRRSVLRTKPVLWALCVCGSSYYTIETNRTRFVSLFLSSYGVPSLCHGSQPLRFLDLFFVRFFFCLFCVPAGKYGAYLLACYEPDREEYQSVCKIGTGFTDDILHSFWEDLKEHTVENRPRYCMENIVYLSSACSDAVVVVKFDGLAENIYQKVLNRKRRYQKIKMAVAPPPQTKSSRNSHSI